MPFSPLIGTDTRGSDMKRAHLVEEWEFDSVQVRSFIKRGSDKCMDDESS